MLPRSSVISSYVSRVFPASLFITVRTHFEATAILYTSSHYLQSRERVGPSPFSPSPADLSDSSPACLLCPYPYCWQLDHMSKCVPEVPPSLPPDLQTITSPLILGSWETLSQGHPDKDFVRLILEGIQFGFHIGFNYQHLKELNLAKRICFLHQCTRWWWMHISATNYPWDVLPTSRRRPLSHGSIAVPSGLSLKSTNRVSGG